MTLNLIDAALFAPLCDIGRIMIYLIEVFR